MDIDPCPQFYDDFPSLMEQEYNLHDFDEILNSATGFNADFVEHLETQTQSSDSGLSEGSTLKTEEKDFNPDEFFNFPIEDDVKSEQRSTPSPASSSGCESHSLMLETPPISPGQSNYTLPTVAPINLLNGTLIPIKTLPLATMPIAPAKPKTLVLSQKDYNALMQKMKNSQSAPRIIVKSGLKKPPVLPKSSIPAPRKTETPVPQVVGRADLPPLTSVVDERMLKKHQRMIKNRESASLSRKKKKDYVDSLEIRIGSLEQENVQLKEENSTLRSQLSAFAQSCQCNGSKLTEFVANRLQGGISCHQAKGKFFTANMKKNTAVFLAMVFMISLNLGKFHTLISPEMDAGLSSEVHVNGRRSLLWVSQEDEESSNKTRQGPLTFNETMEMTRRTVDKCPMSINQTENLRLASELRKWIGVNDFHNLTEAAREPKLLKVPSDVDLMEDMDADFKSLFQNVNEMKKFLRRNRKNFFFKSKKTKAKGLPLQHPLQIYKPKPEHEYTRLFNGIRRRDDTFYVLSFHSDHILLPAAAYNKTMRPKMSLMLPAGDASVNGEIVMMQIDCEVLNTSLVQLKRDMIPESLRPTTKLNVNESSTPAEVNATRARFKSHREPTKYRSNFLNHTIAGRPVVPSLTNERQQQPNNLLLATNHQRDNSSIGGSVFAPDVRVH